MSVCVCLGGGGGGGCYRQGGSNFCDMHSNMVTPNHSFPLLFWPETNIGK